MKKSMRNMVLLAFILLAQPVFSQLRPLDSVFPNLGSEAKAAIFSEDGYIAAFDKDTEIRLLNSDGLDPMIKSEVLAKKPACLVESLLVLSAATPDGQAESFSLIDAYNALGNIRGLKGRLYHSFTRNESVPLFEDATRLLSEKKSTPVADPPPASALPQNETVFLRLKDANFGNSYYRGDMVVDRYGLRYRLANNKTITYFLVPVMKEEKFIAQLYFEPIEEGMLIYSIAGADVSDFVYSKIDISSAISKRLAVITSWVAEGILKQRR